MSHDSTFTIEADAAQAIRQLHQLRSQLDYLSRVYRRIGPRPGCGWRWRKGQARR